MNWLSLNFKKGTFSDFFLISLSITAYENPSKKKDIFWNSVVLLLAHIDGAATGVTDEKGLLTLTCSLWELQYSPKSKSYE